MGVWYHICLTDRFCLTQVSEKKVQVNKAKGKYLKICIPSDEENRGKKRKFSIDDLKRVKRELKKRKATPKKVAKRLSDCADFGKTINEKTIRRNCRLEGQRKGNHQFLWKGAQLFWEGETTPKYVAKRIPKQTPQREDDPEIRTAYAEEGPILNGGQFGIVTLSEDWEERKKEICWGDDKPWWRDSSSAKNRYYCDFGDGSGPPEILPIDKHTPHFMNFHLLGWHSKVLFFQQKFSVELVHWYSRKVRNKNRTKNAAGDRVRKYHFEHPKIDGKLVVKTFKEFVFPHCHIHGYKLIILDNDSKFHSKALVEAAKEEGLQIYPGSGKRCWVNFWDLRTSVHVVRIQIMGSALMAPTHHVAMIVCRAKQNLQTRLKMLS